MAMHALVLQYVSILLIFYIVSVARTQVIGNDCRGFFRQVRRSGMSISGKLEIPVDEFFPRYQLRLRFNRAIHHMTVRQMKARDIGTHKEFVLDPMEQSMDGILRLRAVIRLRTIMGPTPKLTRIVYNNRAMCGEPVSISEINESIIIEPPTSPTTAVPVPIVIPSTTTKINKDEEDDVDSDILRSLEEFYL